jgi:hypothetical protein
MNSYIWLDGLSSTCEISLSFTMVKDKCWQMHLSCFAVRAFPNFIIFSKELHSHPCKPVMDGYE